MASIETGSSENKEQAARQICAVLRAAGFRALFAGGCVRDYLLHAIPHDIDIASNASPEDVIRLFPRTCTVGAQFGVVLVIRPEGVFEVAAFRGDGPYLDGRHPASISFSNEFEDAKRRDFTINALFRDPETNETLDYVGGMEDLREGLICAVGDPFERFAEDWLRMPRAVRFAARLSFKIEAKTWNAIRSLAHKVSGISVERIRDELLKMLTEGNARRAVELLNEAELLDVMLPEVAAMRGVKQPDEFHPEGDVFEHTLCALALLPPRVAPTLALATLLHDIGKPATQSFEDRIRFNFHEKVGARMSESLCQRLHLSSQDTARIVWLVENHMRLIHFHQMRKHRRLRLARMEGFDDLLALCRMDALASHGDTQQVDDAEAYVAAMNEEELRPPRLLTGHDLIAMGYSPGPLLKRILRDVETQQLEGMLRDAESAKRFVQEKYRPTS